MAKLKLWLGECDECQYHGGWPGDGHYMDRRYHPFNYWMTVIGGAVAVLAIPGALIAAALSYYL